MRNAFLRFIVGTTLGLGIAAVVAFNAALLWVATGPRALDVLTPYIEASFEPADHSHSILIGETWLIWDGWKHPIDIRLKNVSVMTAEKQRFSKFPEISLGLDVFSLMIGRILPTSLTITHPVLSLYQNDDHSISFGFKKETAEASEPAAAPEAGTDNMMSVPLQAVLAPLLSPETSGSLSKLHLVTILNADISVGNIHKGIFFKATSADMVFRSNHEGMQAMGSAAIAYDGYESMIHSQIDLVKGSPTIEAEMTVGQLMPGLLADHFVENTMLGALKFPVSGKGKLSMDRASGKLLALNFNIDGGKGTIETDKLDGIVPVTTLHVEGNVGNSGNDINITKLSANLDGMLIDADAAVTLKDKDAAVRANFYLKNILSSQVHLLWPPTFAPLSREWVTTNISDGVSPEAESHFNIAFGDLAKPNLPKKAVESTIVLEGAKVRYLPDHPELNNVKGHIHVDGESMEATIDSGQYMKDTSMSNGKLIIEDINADNPYIKISMDAESSAKDIVRFLNLPRLKHAQRLNLQEDTAEGSAKGHVSVGFTFFAPKDENGKEKDADITYDLTADIKGITQPGFMKKFDIKNANGTMSVNNSVIDFKGSGEVNGASVTDSSVKYLFKPEDGFDTIIEANATAPVETLPRFGYPAFPFLKGVLGIKATVKEGATTEEAQASINLTNATVKLPLAGWNKPDKEPATFDITSRKKDDVATIPSFSLKGKDVEVQGSAELNKELSDIRRVNLDKVRVASTDLDNLVYEHIEGGFKLDAQGKSADLSSWVDTTPGEEGTFSFANFPAAQIKLDVKQMVFGKGRTLNGVKGELTCDPKRCASANIGGTTVDKKPFSFRILRNPKGNRQVSLHAESAGAFLKAVNMFDGMEGGDLTITGTYNDSGENSVLRGKADITEHVIKDAPVLAKILSLASLTGFFDTLQGKGIQFDRSRAPFTLSKDVITLKEAKTHGSAIGMTVEGTITFPKRTLDLQGTIVPSYTLNNVLGKVPILGAVLTGGEGQGVFAARYSVKGSGNEPEVSVNPLSILTPGFLRGLFDIFDGPKKEEEDDSQ